MSHKQPPHAKITLTIPQQLLEQVDAAAEHDYTTRSDVLRQALLEYLRLPEILTGEPDLETAFQILRCRRAQISMKQFMKENKNKLSRH